MNVVEMIRLLVGISPPAKLAADATTAQCVVARAQTRSALNDLVSEIIMLHNQRVSPGLNGVAH